MSIEVNQVTKVYGEQKALKDVSFSIKTGEVVGFLGPNGAGKSTLMKIITGVIPPTSGQVKVEGFDVVTDDLEVKRFLGYLPENNPLYLDMFVKEYLEFVAGMYHQQKRKGGGDGVKDRIDFGAKEKNWGFIKRISATGGFSSGINPRSQGVDSRRTHLRVGPQSNY